MFLPLQQVGPKKALGGRGAPDSTEDKKKIHLSILWKCTITRIKIQTYARRIEPFVSSFFEIQTN